MKDIYVAIDIGTTKICVMIGSVNKADQLEIHGKGVVPCACVKKGVIVDIEDTARSIRMALDQAEREADLKVGSAYVNIYGSHVTLINEKEEIDISNPQKTVTLEEMEKLFHKVEKTKIPENSQIIDIIPREYIIDEYDSVKDPVGMSGFKLEINADIVTARFTPVQNIIKCVEKAGLEVDGIILESFANGEIILGPDELEEGVILVDVGGSMTNVAGFKNSGLTFCDGIPIGGYNISNDISLGLHISFSEGEKLKKQYELALTDLIKHDQDVTIFDIKDEMYKTVKISKVIEIIEARVDEIIYMSRNLAENYASLNNFPSGVVLCGGGISYVNGNRQMAGETFGLPARVASFKSLLGVLKPELATSAGIIKYCKSKNKEYSVAYKTQRETKLKKRGILARLVRFFRKSFF